MAMGRGQRQQTASGGLTMRRASAPAALLPPWERGPIAERVCSRMPSISWAGARLLDHLMHVSWDEDDVAEASSEDWLQLGIDKESYATTISDLLRQGLLQEDSLGGISPDHVLGWDEAQKQPLRSMIPKEQALDWVEDLTDGVGYGVDDGMKPLVAAMLRFGIDTKGSCEGHDDWGMRYPWVTLEPWACSAVLRLVERCPELEGFKVDTRAGVLAPQGLFRTAGETTVQFSSEQRAESRDSLRDSGHRLLDLDVV